MRSFPWSSPVSITSCICLRSPSILLSPDPHKSLNVCQTTTQKVKGGVQLMPGSESQQETKTFCAVLWLWGNAESMHFTASSELMQILENFICLPYPWYQCVSIVLKNQTTKCTTASEFISGASWSTAWRREKELIIGLNMLVNAACLATSRAEPGKHWLC